MSIQTVFASNVSALMKERNLTVRAVANALSVSKPTVHSWINGKSLPQKAETLELLASLLEVTVARLFDDPSTDKPGMPNGWETTLLAGFDPQLLLIALSKHFGLHVSVIERPKRPPRKRKSTSPPKA